MKRAAPTLGTPGRRIVRSVPALALAGAAASAGTLAAVGQEDPTLRFSGESSVAWVLVPVTVRGVSGQVEDLLSEDFRLRVDGQAVPIESFEAGPDAPVRLIYLQDLSGSMANSGKLEASRAAFTWFVESARPGDELALATFASGETRFEVPFTSDKERLEQALAGWSPFGTTSLHDAVARLPEMRAEEGSSGLKRAAVLVTDGGDNASTLAPGRAREIVRAAELPVYVLDLRTHRDARIEAGSFAHLLRLLAVATGGRYRAVVEDNIAAACAAITEALRFQYVLGFQTRDTGQAGYREIQVEVDSEDAVEVSHRRGYVGLPPPVSQTDKP
jgi:Ca-activated chloride channel family protein